MTQSPNGPQAEPIPVSIAHPIPRVAKRLGHEGVAVCTRCRGRLHTVHRHNPDWLHTDTGSAACDPRKAAEWAAFEAKHLAPEVTDT